MAEFNSRQKMMFNKTETEYNMKSIRFILLTITAMFIMIGVLMIVMGISVYSHYHSFSYFYEKSGSGKFFTPSIFSVLLGIAILLVTFVGFFGSLKQSTCMVNLYAFILSIILLMKLIIVIIAFTASPDSMMKYINIPVGEYTSDPEIQAEIDQLQTTINCCGSSSYLDYVGMDFSEMDTIVVYSTNSTGDHVSMVLPASCCASIYDGTCIRIRGNSCKGALVNVIIQNSSVIGVLGVSVMFVQLLGIIFALLLARCIRRLKSEKAVLQWKIKEQMILARTEKEASAAQAQQYEGVY